MMSETCVPDFLFSSKERVINLMQNIKPNVLPLATVRNPRDLGGYIGYEGRKIKKGRLLRTGKISNLSEDDQHFLRNYGLKKIIDLRSPLEIEKCPDTIITGVQHYNIALSDEDNTQGGHRDIAKTFAKYRKDQYAGFRMMCQRYYDHVTKTHAQAAIKQIITLLAQTPEGAIIYHCSEGKDRTGIVTFIILYLLGVDLETIREDYLYSNYMLNTYRAKRDHKFAENGENLKFRANMRILGSVSDAFIDTALIAVQEQYGGLDEYLKKQLGVTDELKDTLRELYLEKK